MTQALLVFDEVRRTHATYPRVNTRVHNCVIAACLYMFKCKLHETVLWVDNEDEFSSILGLGSDSIRPNATTMLDNSIRTKEVISDRSIPDDTVAAGIAHALIRRSSKLSRLTTNSNM